MVKILAILLFVFISLTSMEASATQYWVATTGNDANNGLTTATAWRTLHKANDTMAPGDTTIVRDGTYTEAQISVVIAGTQAAPRTIKAEHKWLAILASTSSCGPAFWVNAAWFTIEDLRIQVSPSNVTCATSRPRSDNAAVRCWTSGGAGCHVKGVKVDASSARDTGIKVEQDNSIVEDSTVSNSIEGFLGNNIIIRNNIVDTCDAWNTCIFTKGGSRNVQIYNNIVTTSGGGILLGGNSSCCWFDAATHIEAYGSIVYNNVVIATGSGTLGYALIGCSNCAIVNNVFIGNATSFAALQYAAGSQALHDPRPNPANPIVKNNIFDCGGGPRAFDNNGSTGTNGLDNNLFYNCAGFVPTQVHAITGSPLFLNRLSDWHLTCGSPALGAGTVFSFTDWSGNPVDFSKNKDGLTHTRSLGIY